MSVYQVTFEVVMPDDAPEHEVQQFIEFEIGARASMNVVCESLKHTDLQSQQVFNVWVTKR